MNSVLTIVPNLLRDRAAFFDRIKHGENIGATICALATSAVLFLVMYGFVTGLSYSFEQALSSAAKLPLLFVATIIFCLPAFYFFSLVLGTQLSMAQVVAVFLAGIGVTAFLLLGLSPVTLFFVLTSENYAFFQLLTVVFVAVSGCVGMYFLWRGMAWIEPADDRGLGNLRRILLGMWFALYAFAGSQMAWRLSPFVGDPSEPFIWLRPSRDNFYVDVLHAIERAFGVERIQLNLGLSGALVAVVLMFVLGIVIGRASRSTPPSIPAKQLSPAGPGTS